MSSGTGEAQQGRAGPASSGAGGAEPCLLRLFLHSFILAPTHSFSHSFTPSFIHSFSHSLTDYNQHVPRTWRGARVYAWSSAGAPWGGWVTSAVPGLRPLCCQGSGPMPGGGLCLQAGGAPGRWTQHLWISGAGA